MAKPRKSKEEKALEAKVEEIVKVSIQDVQIDIMDLSKITDAGMEAGLAFTTEDMSKAGDFLTQRNCAIREAVTTIAAKLRKN